MIDLLRLTRKVIGEIDLRVLPDALAINLTAVKSLIDDELAKPAPQKKVAKKKAKKKVAKKK